MGVLNITPDSFSDGGRYTDPGRAAEHAHQMIREGADLIDVGGESSRPGAVPVDPGEECRRVVPVIARLRAETAAILSIDTFKPEVARRAIDAGADVVNDISALASPGMARCVANAGVPVVLMHMRGTPRTMQRDTRYDDVVAEVRADLAEAVERAVGAGIAGDKILLDPGIGFGKSASGNLEILRRLTELAAIGKPILVGASRKSFIGETLDLPVDERLEGGLAVAAVAAWQGARVVRTHDVAATVRVVRMVDAIRNG